jgi:hypothetical protein
MKRSCFINSLIVLTIILGAVSYIVTQRSDLICNPIKKFASDMAFNEIKEKMVNLPPSEGKDSLVKSFESYLSALPDAKQLSTDKLKEIGDALKTIIADSIITNNEVESFNTLIMKVKEYERREKNRN